MTRDETIRWLEYAKQGEMGKAVEALDMAIKALEQELCGDLISRQAVQTELKNCEVVDVRDENDDFVGYYNADTVDSIVRNLPSVTPQLKTEKVIKMRDATPEERESVDKYVKSISKPTVVNFWDLEQEPKTGHWIMSDDGLYRPICDKCGAHPWKGYIPTVEEATEVFKYCPNCGAKMIKPKESEEK